MVLREGLPRGNGQRHLRGPATGVHRAERGWSTGSGTGALVPARAPDDALDGRGAAAMDERTPDSLIDILRIVVVDDVWIFGRSWRILYRELRRQADVRPLSIGNR